eukprot:jgi/Mesen1/2334/ME000155S01422
MFTGPLILLSLSLCSGVLLCPVSLACRRTLTVTAVQSPKEPKGFGPPPKVPAPPKKVSKPLIQDPSPTGGSRSSSPKSERDEFGSDEEEEGDVPEIVTNRMLQRMLVAVGVPLVMGVGFFPLFYWLKVTQNVEFPEWLPVVVTGSAFGVAGLGISYGVLSTSWDPAREGSLLGWREARANWPVMMQNIRGDGGKDK